MERVHVKPSETALIRQPERGYAPMSKGGDWVARNVHYTHLIATGDLIVSDPQPEMPRAPEKSQETTAALAAPTEKPAGGRANR